MATSFTITKQPMSIAAAACLLCLVVMTTNVSSFPTASICSSINATSDTTVQSHIEQVLGGIEILIRLGSRLNGTRFDIPDFQNVSRLFFGYNS